MSNIAPYNEKKGNNEPKRAVNKMRTGERETGGGETPPKSTHDADYVTVSMSGVFPLSFLSATVLHRGHTGLAITQSTEATIIDPCILSLNLQQY